ncbi:MAG: M15 family metallopeptidase [Saprospiraceae bacterium]
MMDFKNRKVSIGLLSLTLCFAACKDDRATRIHPKSGQEPSKSVETRKITVDTSPTYQLTSPTHPIKKQGKKAIKNEENWAELTQNQGYILDIRYATTNNFTKKKIYDCAKCYVRPEAATALKTIQKELKDKFGYGIKLFDCYRPGPYQQRLWDIVANPDYVTPPNKGSMHSRGLALDLTLTDKHGKELDMGTPFDFFGKEAHHGYAAHSDAVKRNRWILRSTMEKHGFGSIRTEWWHYSYKSKSYPLDEWIWPCEEQ